MPCTTVTRLGMHGGPAGGPRAGGAGRGRAGRAATAGCLPPRTPSRGQARGRLRRRGNRAPRNRPPAHRPCCGRRRSASGSPRLPPRTAGTAAPAPPGRRAPACPLCSSSHTPTGLGTDGTIWHRSPLGGPSSPRQEASS